MQLFHKNQISIKNNEIRIDDKETIEQCRKVLRLKKGDIISIQSTLANTTTRYLINIQEISDKIVGTIIEKEEKIHPLQRYGIIIAMPNKREKIETITQKLTEIGIDEIVFWPAERSVIKQRNKNKVPRLQKIMQEAVEQSRWRFLPEMSFREHPEDLIKDTNVIIFDKQENKNENSRHNEHKKQYGIIGPEWGLTTKDKAIFLPYHPNIKDLWETILRTETAAIIGGRILKNK